MKTIMLTFVAVATLASAAVAGSTCRYDYFGNYVCSYTGGGTTTTRTDYFGNDVTTGTGKFRTFKRTCKTDYFGNYVCR